MKIDIVHDEPTGCRWCGAVQAAPHPNDAGMCLTCWNRAEYERLDDIGRTEKLIKRVFKFAGGQKAAFRCEALKQHHLTKSIKGYQCGSYAREIRDGHHVCDAHSRSASNEYVGSNPASFATELEATLRHLVEREPEVVHVLQAVITRATPTPDPDAPFQAPEA